MFSGAFLIYLAGPAPPSNFHGGVLFDEPVLDVIGASDSLVGDVAATTSTTLFYGAMAYRVVDSLLIPAFVHDDWHLAHQLSMIDMTAFGFSGLVLWGTQLAVGRTRPKCEPEIGNGPCSDEHNVRRSFIAGHAATGFTAAGLTCTHHAHIPLYGGSADSAACAVTVTAAVVNSVGRAVSENHYPTDVLMGVALGSFSGWFLPAALHYGFGNPTATSRHEGGSLNAVVVPQVDQRRLGAALVGVF